MTKPDNRLIQRMCCIVSRVRSRLAPLLSINHQRADPPNTPATSPASHRGEKGNRSRCPPSPYGRGGRGERVSPYGRGGRGERVSALWERGQGGEGVALWERGLGGKGVALWERVERDTFVRWYLGVDSIQLVVTCGRIGCVHVKPAANVRTQPAITVAKPAIHVAARLVLSVFLAVRPDYSTR